MCLYPRNLRRCISVALIVGTILVVINQLDVLVSGRGSAVTWLKIGITYLVPFFVSNYGILIATHRPAKLKSLEDPP